MKTITIVIVDSDKPAEPLVLTKEVSEYTINMGNDLVDISADAGQWVKSEIIGGSIHIEWRP